MPLIVVPALVLASPVLFLSKTTLINMPNLSMVALLTKLTFKDVKDSSLMIMSAWASKYSMARAWIHKGFSL
jgi:hypothetical protein